MCRFFVVLLFSSISHLVWSQDIHEDYESYVEPLGSAMEGLSNAIEAIAEANETISGANVVMTREMQQQIVVQGRMLSGAITSALTYSERLQTRSVDPDTCRSMIATARTQLAEVDGLIHTFESLNVEGDQKAEAMSMAAIDFLGPGLFAANVIIEPLSTCAYVRAL